MTTRSLVFVSLLLLLAGATAYAQADATLLFAELRGSNEVPPTTSTVVGAALITIDSSNLLTFELNAPGIVSPVAAHIHNAPAGVPAGVFQGFTPPATTATFSGGRLKGTVQLTQAQADAIRANPANFYVNIHTAANPGGEIRGQLAPATEQDVPIAGSVTTGNGDKFVTDTRVFNPSSTSRSAALIEFFASGTSANVNSTASTTIDLAPRAEAVLDDVTRTALGVPGTTGALRVTSSTGVVVTSNIFNDQRGAVPSRGTFGQFVPAIARANALMRSVVIHVTNQNRNPASPSGFRTNVGFFNPNQETAIVGLTLRDATGAMVATTSIVLPGLSQQQAPITSYFATADLSHSGELTLSINSTLPILAYGAVNDNISGDSFLVPAQPDSGVTP